MKLIVLALSAIVLVGCCGTPAFPTTSTCVTPVQLQQAPQPCPIEVDPVAMEGPEATNVRVMILWKMVERLEARVDQIQGIR